MKNITITSSELRALLFWAIAGFTESNGGCYERKIPKIIAKYCKEIKMGRSQFPPMGIQSSAKLLGHTKEAVEKALKLTL